MKIKTRVLLMLIVVIISVCLYFNRSSVEVLLVVPDQYRGELAIKQDAANGRQLDSAALENFGDYVYEFQEVTNGIVYVKNISHIRTANKINVSEMSVAPLNSKVISRNKDTVIIDVLD